MNSLVIKADFKTFAPLCPQVQSYYLIKSTKSCIEFAIVNWLLSFSDWIPVPYK